MSRVGKMPVTVPQGVDVSIQADRISVKGKGGALSVANNPLVNVVSDAGKISFLPANESREANAMSGTLRQLVNNMVVGHRRLREEADPGWRGLQGPGCWQQAQPRGGLLAPGEL